MEIKLSDRMKAVADMVSGRTAADIGCDHGFVSIYLVQNSIVDNVIAMDLRVGPLSSAREHIEECGLSDKISVRLSDGFEKLGSFEADCAVIAGMGGMLMTDILKKGKIHTDNGIKLVLQPQSDYDSVRAYLQQIDYIIDDEAILMDEGKYYFIIKASNRLASDEVGLRPAMQLTAAELLYGPILLKKRDSVLKEYLCREELKCRELISSLSKVGTERAGLRCESLTEELAVINTALGTY